MIDNWLDDILGSFDILDWLESWFAFAIRGRGTVEYRMNLNNDCSLNEVIAHLDRYGVKAVRSGFNSTSMTYKISSRQERWHNRLVAYSDGVPILYYPNRSWRDSRGRVHRRRNLL